jgi:hypothetical protein
MRGSGGGPKDAAAQQKFRLDFRHFGRPRGGNEAPSQRELRGSRSKMAKVESDTFGRLDSA